LDARLRAGEFGNVSTVVTLIAGPEGLSNSLMGRAPSGYEMMGMFECAKLQCFAADADDE
jgi:hypothetical protein